MLELFGTRLVQKERFLGVPESCVNGLRQQRQEQTKSSISIDSSKKSGHKSGWKKQKYRGINQTSKISVDVRHERPLNLVLSGQCLHQQLFRKLQESGRIAKCDKSLHLSWKIF